MPESKSAIIIGSGFAGLSAAASLAKEGWKVTVIEKNEQLGGRAAVWERDGFTFDMGPSWYWMPEIFNQFYKKNSHKTEDFYELKRLDPSYRVFFGEDDSVDVPASLSELHTLFEKLQPGSSIGLKKFLEEAQLKYKVAMDKFVWLPGLNWTELLQWELLKYVPQLHMFGSITEYVAKFITEPRLRQILEFPVLFLGAKPSDTPALYSMMNYADLVLGTWYPMGGMNKIPKAFAQICTENGVEFLLNTEAEEIVVNESGKAIGVRIKGKLLPADVVISSADYHHTETHLLKPKLRQYSQNYWDSRKMAPSSLLYYVGVNKKLSGLLHHNLFFDTDFELHSNEIYTQPTWPTSPLFYASCPSVTDESVAPKGCENLFILIPTAPGLQENEAIAEEYFEKVITRMEKLTEQSIKEHILFKRSFGCSDFEQRYNSFKGNAYGLANTLMQTANLKPSIKSKKVSNLWFCGQLTLPGPGVPPAIISGQMVAREILKGER